MYSVGNAGVCRQITQSTQLRDVAWMSNSCTISFQTVGIWPEGADGTDVNACEVSHSKKILVSGDDFGKVRLYTYPVTQPKVIYNAYVYMFLCSCISRFMFFKITFVFAVFTSHVWRP